MSARGGGDGRILAGVADLPCRAFDFCQGTGCTYQCGLFPCITQGDGFPDPPTGAGDDGSFSFQYAHIGSLRIRWTGLPAGALCPGFGRKIDQVDSRVFDFRVS